MTRSRRTLTWIPLFVFVGALLLQTAWILAVPPFRGIDEFSHAFRAAAVAHGQWIAEPSEATAGTGAVLTVPEGLVTAARPICHAKPYTTAEDCEPVSSPTPDGMADIGSSAGRYHPAFYWVVGSFAEPFEGYPALYAMRVATALLSAALLALAAGVLVLWARTRWMLAGLLLSATPVVLYSTSIVSPNGVEICAAAVLWASALGLCRNELPSSDSRALIIVGTFGASILATLRPLGLLWVLLIALTVLPIAWPVLTSLVRRHARTLGAGAAVTAAVAVASLTWIQTQDALVLRNDGQSTLGDPVLGTLAQLPVWLLQSIAAFPGRMEPAPTIVYATYVIAGLAFMAVGYYFASKLYRMVLFAVLAITVLFPFATTVATWDLYGPSWQGRYGLPFSIGLILIAAMALDSREARHRWSTRLLIPMGLALCLAQIVSVVRVVVNEQATSVLAGSDGWITTNSWVAGLLAGLGGVAWLLAVSLGQPSAQGIEVRPPRAMRVSQS